MHRIEGPVFATWLIEADALAGQQEPILALMSRVFLSDRRGIINELRRGGFYGLLYFVLQQIQQFQVAGESFMIGHKDVDVMNEVEEELRNAVLAAIPPEQRLQGIPPEEILRSIPPEEILRGISPEERLRGLSLEERLQGLSEEEFAQHRRLLDRESDES